MNDAIGIKRLQLNMFCIINTNRIAANCLHVLPAVRNMSNLRKLNSAARINKYGTQDGTLHNINLAKQNEGPKMACGLQVRPFHVTANQRTLPPSVIILLGPLWTIAPILLGRKFRKWWRALPPERKKELILRIKNTKMKIIALGVLSLSGIACYYTSHLEEQPLTGRKKFILLKNEDILQLAQLEDLIIKKLFKDCILPKTHPDYKRVLNVMKKLLNSNKNIEQLRKTNWTLSVLDVPKYENAAILPTGNMYVTNAFLDLCSNDDQLCAVLAHEIAHVLLSHSAEYKSRMEFFDRLLIVPLAIMWAFLPALAALAAHCLTECLASLVLELPLARANEFEADKVGLLLTAKACYDVREASAFFATHATIYKEGAEWLQTHPNSETRRLKLEAIMPIAIRLREKYKCPPLPSKDPR